jgi:ribosome maturation factor RimP
MLTPSAITPALLTPEIHTHVLEKLAEIAERVNETHKSTLRVRDWVFEKEGNVLLFDVFLDCGSHTLAPDMNLCSAFHEILLDEAFVNSLPDDIELRVGSAGAECALRTAEHFEPFVHQMIFVESWDGKQREFKLVEVNAANGNISVTADHQSKTPFVETVPLNEVKRAKALYFHEVSKKHRQKESHKKRDFRPKREKMT